MSGIPGLPSAGPISRVSAADLGPLRAGSPWLREPVVVTGASCLMNEVWRWTPDHLRATVGDERLPATLPGPDGGFRYEPGRVLGSRPLAVSRFFDDMADPDGPRWCLQQVPVESALPALSAVLDYPTCVPRELVNAVNLWLASPGTVTPLHYDDTHNLFCQVSGAKTFYVLPPEDLDALYPGPLNTGAQHLSGVNLFQPDFERHPRAAPLRYLEATVRAGEALVLPAFWWHQVLSREEVAVSVNFWWRANVVDCLVPGFMRQLQSAAVQDDLGALAGTFELGDGQGGADVFTDAADLVRLLHDIGEAKAALALTASILRTAQRRSGPAAARAGELLADHEELLEAPGRSGAAAAGRVDRLVADLTAIVSEGARSW
ncbi:hypothetical protein GCM10009527_027540 [Actinomadura nitritigenes]|uniref:Cupin-like domain-containing protein n=1 Tax=Actinomadura nitritigenes TaxID=134602 RepID=A0ABS3RCN0_9ACTN|nr:cupin-like domain-containing protein [Actinomadura nitritigenes]MBO2443980.1 cupin-like domain-containing protein [Actinomadura nitritigenes]